MIEVQFRIFLLILWLGVVRGAANFSPIEEEEQYGKTVKFCTYKGLRILPRSVFKDFDTCTRCVCKRLGLECTTLSTAFRVTAPEDSRCTSVQVGCKNRWVLKKNNNRRCPKKLIPTNISMVGK